MATKNTGAYASKEQGFAGITGAYLAVTAGNTRRAAYLLWRWASLVAMGVIVLYVVIHFVVKYW